jgi:hypothetical protein
MPTFLSVRLGMNERHASLLKNELKIAVVEHARLSTAVRDSFHLWQYQKRTGVKANIYYGYNQMRHAGDSSRIWPVSRPWILCTPLLRGVLVPSKDSSRGPASVDSLFRCAACASSCSCWCLAGCARRRFPTFAGSLINKCARCVHECSKFELAFYRYLVELPYLFDPQTHHVNTEKEVPQWRSDPRSFVVPEKENLRVEEMYGWVAFQITKV